HKLGTSLPSDSIVFSDAGYLVPRWCILTRSSALPLPIQGKSRMRQSRSYGSVRGVRGNSHPYRDIVFCGLSGSSSNGDRRHKPIVCPTSDLADSTRMYKLVTSLSLFHNLLRLAIPVQLLPLTEAARSHHHRDRVRKARLDVSIRLRPAAH